MQIYIHIPFCIRKCNYCDFLSFACDEDMKKKYVQALIEEIRSISGKCHEIERDVSTIFIGGGTPSSIDGMYIEHILNEVRDVFKVREDAEITIECNPGTVDAQKLKHYTSAGINRVSMGLQTTDDEALIKLGRIHTYEQFLQSYDCVRNAGIHNVNVDIMSGLPGQSVDKYSESVENVCKLNPEHISAYSLIVEEGTPFYEMYNDENGIKTKELPDEESERRQYYITKDILNKYGYSRYEISNYSKKGYECVHNCGYWRRNPYIGFGLGAASLYNETRYNNTDDMKEYLAYSSNDSIRRNIQRLTVEEQMEEFMFLGLRMCDGVSVIEFEQKFGKSIDGVFGRTIEKYLSLEMLSRENDIIRLTDRGIDVSNIIFSDFIL